MQMLLILFIGLISVGGWGYYREMLRIDKGSRCVLRYTYILLITLMAFELL